MGWNGTVGAVQRCVGQWVLELASVDLGVELGQDRPLPPGRDALVLYLVSFGFVRKVMNPLANFKGGGVPLPALGAGQRYRIASQGLSHQDGLG